MPQDRAKRPDLASSGSNPAPAAGGLPPGDAADPPGTYFLGRYRVVDEIGVGGMASVHLARMDGPGGFQKWVAIKKIHSHLVEDESFVQMFLDEARVAARISHPNVATVFDLGKHDTTYWIAMEYLHGEPLREVMRRTEELGTAMPPEIACRVIADAAEGLHAAHELLGKNGEKLNLVHRDVTPHNLFVTYDGVTKVVDFGIAKFSSRASQTRAGTLKGKLAYMSPEQVQGEAIDRRTDIFALGVVLWELTTGQRLFRMESDIDTLARVQECIVPRPSSLVRGYPIDLEKIVMKTLAKNRGERFRTARELSRALQSLLMRRGLFIASDEVASYTQSIFADRIQKREAHLRWASDVTQTINVEQLGASVDRPIDADPLPSASAIPRVAPAAGGAPRPGPAAPVPAPLPAAGKPAMATLPDAWSDDAPTSHGIPLMEERASPATQLAASRGQAAQAQESGSGVAVLHDDELEEDQDETLVAMAGEPNGPPSDERPTLGHAHSQPQGFPHVGQHGGPNAFPPGPQHGFGGVPSRTGDVPYAAYPESPSMSATAGYQYPPVQQPPPQDAFNAGTYPMPSSTGYARRGDAPNRGTSDGRNHRTMLAQRFRRRPPMWIVAAFSGSLALFFAGVVMAIISTTNPKTRSRPTGPVTSAPVGPFTTARTAFNAAIASASSSAPAPVVPNAVAPTTTSAAPPVIAPPEPAPAAASAPPAAAPSPPPAAPTAPPAQTHAPAPPAAAPPAAVAPAPQPKAAPAAAAPAAKGTLGTLTVVCLGSKCDQITDNGIPIGAGNVYGRPVPTGRHLLVLSAQNGVKKSVQVEVLPNQSSEVRLPMDKP